MVTDQLKLNPSPPPDQPRQHYAIDKPRPYHLMVLFTALSEKYNCRTCRWVSGVNVMRVSVWMAGQGP